MYFEVKLWISFNEPWIVSWLGYGVSSFAPAKWGPGTNTYIVSHNIIKAHAKSFHTYNDTYRRTQNGIDWLNYLKVCSIIGKITQHMGENDFFKLYLFFKE